jgi:hypothetical protein
MPDQYVQVQQNSNGLKIDTSELTVGQGELANTVERQRVVIGDPVNPVGLASVSALGEVSASDAQRIAIAWRQLEVARLQLALQQQPGGFFPVPETLFF